jgi:hypothetical protein
MRLVQDGNPALLLSAHDNPLVYFHTLVANRGAGGQQSSGIKIHIDAGSAGTDSVEAEGRVT